MAVTGFNHYNLRAPRQLLDQLRDFYCNVVGLQQGQRPAFRSFGYWLYIGEHDVLHLSEAPLEEIRAVHVATTFDHVAFTCNDAEGMKQKLSQFGIDYRIANVAQTGIQQIFFRDPAGNGVELNISPDSL